MAQARVIESIDAPLARVWARLGNFTGIEIGPDIEAVEYSGEGVGMTRTIQLPIGTVVERLDGHDSESFALSYSIVNDDSPLPFADYSAIMKLSEIEPGTTQVDWTGTFEPKGVEEERAVKFAKIIYTRAIALARAALEAPQG